MGAARSKGEVLKMFGGAIVSLAVKRIEALMDTPYAEVQNMSVQELLEKGLMDPVRLFVKNEPHSQAKLAEGKYRLISSVSLVDEIVERVLNGGLNGVEIANWDRIWSKSGMGHDDDKMKILFASLEGHRLASTDMSNWDWGCSGLELGIDALLRGEALKFPEPWRNALLNRARALAVSPLVLSNGHVYVPLMPGIQKSGSYNTSSSNSRIRVLCAFAIGASYCAAMGDDSVETPVDDAVAKYAQLGHKCKEYTVYPVGFEFCSHRHETWKGVPVNPGKSLHRLLHSTADEEKLNEAFGQFAEHLRHHPRAEEYVRVARKALALRA